MERQAQVEQEEEAGQKKRKRATFSEARGIRAASPAPEAVPEMKPEAGPAPNMARETAYDTLVSAIHS